MGSRWVGVGNVGVGVVGKVICNCHGRCVVVVGWWGTVETVVGVCVGW